MESSPLNNDTTPQPPYQYAARQRLVRPAIAVITGGLLLTWGFWLGNNYQILINSNSTLPSISVVATGKSVLNDPLLTQVRDLLQTKYLHRNELDQKKLLYGAITGMVSAAGDPYTSFFDPTQNKDIQTQLSGSYEGIGAQLGFKDKQMVIIAPIKDTPASAAGIRAGDDLVKIGDKSTNGMSLDQAVALIRGKAGTPIALTTFRDGQDKPQVVNLTRQSITIKTVDVTFKQNPNLANPSDTDVAYITISRFGDNTIKEWDDAISQVKAKGAKSVVLDVRDNPGGYLEAAIHIGSEFFKDGKIVGEQNAQGDQTYSGVDHIGLLQDVPVAVLINKGSASASEIVSGALQSRGRAVLVGENSFGKGSVQQVIDLPSGTSLHVTIAKWLMPNGKNIDKVGIKPDQVVTLTDDDIKAGNDTQLSAAIKAVAK